MSKYVIKFIWQLKCNSIYNDYIYSAISRIVFDLEVGDILLFANKKSKYLPPSRFLILSLCVSPSRFLILSLSLSLHVSLSISHSLSACLSLNISFSLCMSLSLSLNILISHSLSVRLSLSQYLILSPCITL